MKAEEPRPLYEDLAWTYDLLFAESVDERVDTIEEWLRHGNVERGSTVLDAGCGTGRYSRELATRGYGVIGVDSSEQLLAQAAIHASRLSITLLCCDLDRVELPGPVDAVLCRGVLNDVLDDDGRDRIFARFASALRPGGLLILDVRDWNTSKAYYVAHPVSERRVSTPDGVLLFRSSTTVDERGERLLVAEDFEFTATVVRNSFEMRCWSRDEVAERLRATGFAQPTFHEGYGATAFPRRDRIVAVAQRLG